MRQGPSRQIWRDVGLPSGAVGSLVCADGLVAAPDGPSDGAAVTWAAGGWTVLPRLADAHVHPDKTLWGSRWRPHRAGGDVLTRVAIEQDVLLQEEPTEVRAERLLAQLVRNGVTAARCHVDVSGELGSSRLDPLLVLRDRWRDSIDLQFVAFPQEGIVRSRGTASAMRDAIRAGCEVVGGLDPQAVDEDRDAHLAAIIGLAVDHRARVDVHLHERGAEGAATMLRLADLTEEARLQHKVAISHAFALADLWSADRKSFEEVVDGLLRAGITIVTSLPGEGLCPPVPELIRRRVPTVVGSDNIRDCWSPFGRGDPLERVYLAAYQNGWRTDEQLAAGLDLVTTAASTLMGLPPATLADGDPADFTLVRAPTLPEGILDQPADRIVVRGGRVVAGDDHLRSLPTVQSM